MPIATDQDGWSALLVAVKEENSDIVIELLDAGADIEAADCVSERTKVLIDLNSE